MALSSHGPTVPGGLTESYHTGTGGKREGGRFLTELLLLSDKNSRGENNL